MLGNCEYEIGKLDITISKFLFSNILVKLSVTRKNQRALLSIRKGAIFRKNSLQELGASFKRLVSLATLGVAFELLQ